MVKPEAFGYLHLVYHFPAPLIHFHLPIHQFFLLFLTIIKTRKKEKSYGNLITHLLKMKNTC